MLDFQKRKKKYWDLALHDGTRLQIPTPTMGIYNAMQEISEQADNADVEELGRVIAQILRANRKNLEITEAQIQAFDLEDMYELFAGYMKFIEETLSDPNSKSPTAR